MNKHWTNLHVLPAAVLVWLLFAAAANGGKEFEIPLRNPAFTQGVDKQGVPQGWSKYGGQGKNQDLGIVDGPSGTKMLFIADGDATAELGVLQQFALKGGETYRVTVQVQGVDGFPAAGAHLQFRFLPSHQLVQKDLTPSSVRQLSEVSVQATAPPGTTHGVIYLYSHREPTPHVLVTNVRLWGGVAPLPAPPPPAPPVPSPVPPQYEKLKNLHLAIPLVQGGQPRAAIVAPSSGVYAGAAAVIQTAIEKRAGVKVPIVGDDSPQVALPNPGNMIVLGNRSTNRALNALYDLYYCLVDLKYPGPEGFVLRSVHNPFGNGSGVLVVGASDAAGVEAGARALADILAKTPAEKGDLALGWTMVTRLGKGVQVPKDVKQFETWEASKGYGSVGYFGWTSITKRMAMYYMTGDEFSAREVIRLSFPDKRAIQDIEDVDGERIENKHDPLAGFYHYNAHLAILFWDLIEESPVFSDAERLQVTNAFARQLNHRKGEGVYGLTRRMACVGSRHGQWSAISLYCLGRYFQKDYPSPVWAQCLRGSQLAFQTLHDHAWVAGENDNLFWYSTAIAPVLTYMTLSGDRKPLENGVLGDLLRGQEILSSGRVPDWALNSAAMSFLNQAAYLTGDGRWITYRQRTGVDTNIFRLGQSFWPDERLKPSLPTDLAGKWSILRLPQPAWKSRASGLFWDQSFYFGSYRSTGDAGGDYILLDGFNGASRNPYHTFDILELRLGGQTILQGYHNQVLTSADAMVEPAVAMDAALLYSDVVGATATAVGEVRKAAFCNWRRTLAQRTGRYTLVADDLTFRTDSQNMKVTTAWQVVGGRWDANRQAVRIPAASRGRSPGFELRSCDVQETGGRDVVSMTWKGAVKKGSHRVAFYLLAPVPGESPQSSGELECLRLADNAAMLALPQTALAVVGEYRQMKGDLVILAQDHVYGRAMQSAGIDGPLVAGDSPVDLDWDLRSGTLHVVTSQPTTLRLSLNDSAISLEGASVTSPRPQGGRGGGGEGGSPPPQQRNGPSALTPRPQAGEANRAVHLGQQKLPGDSSTVKKRGEGGIVTIALPQGRHVLAGALPDAKAVAAISAGLQRLQRDACGLRAPALTAGARPVPSGSVEWPGAIKVQVASSVADLIQIPSSRGIQLAVAEGNSIHLLSRDGKEVGRLQTDGKIRVLHWWNEPKLLLAGCVDEKVIAFDAGGQRKWVFTSQMDPAVYEAAKTYWFKSAPGHEGIHGLYSGTFDEGKSRCFVGSACTLEILDETGKLVKRTPVFWGPGVKFLLVPARDNTRNLLVSRWPNGTDNLAMVNSKTLTDVGRGYDGVPAGHSFVGGWTAQNRTALFHEDLDADGKKEIATAINGTWNRVTVYAEDGRPLANAQFGPGASNAPRAQMRDMDVADLDGDGKKELIVGHNEGLVVALTGKCERLWSASMPSPPVSLRCIAPRGPRRPWIVVGCEDGAVVALDNQGAVLQRGKVNGRPTHMVALDDAPRPMVVLATDRGEVKAFAVGE